MAETSRHGLLREAKDDQAVQPTSKARRPSGPKRSSRQFPSIQGSRLRAVVPPDGALGWIVPIRLGRFGGSDEAAIRSVAESLEGLIAFERDTQSAQARLVFEPKVGSAEVVSRVDELVARVAEIVVKNTKKTASKGADQALIHVGNKKLIAHYIDFPGEIRDYILEYSAMEAQPQPHESNKLRMSDTSPDGGVVFSPEGDIVDLLSGADVVASLKRAITRRAEEVESASSSLERAVRLARETGLTWAQIGEASGLSAEGARRRWNSDARMKNATDSRDRARKRRSTRESTQLD